MIRELKHANLKASDRPRLGIVGGGQLARMLIEASVRLDVEMLVLAANAEDGAVAVAPNAFLGDHDDVRAVRSFAARCDIITFEHERTPAPVLEALEASGTILRPGGRAMSLASDKAEQRRLATELGLPVAPHAVVDDPDGLADASARLGLPLVAKAIRGGYDGRGVRWLRSTAACDELAEQLDRDPSGWLVEPDLDIERELAVQVVRRANGDVAVYPLSMTVQRDGICRTAIAPAPVDPDLGEQLVALAVRLVEHLGLIGVLAVEAFVVDGRLLLNELAPRPHNSGHHTIDACVTSQFENHIRAVLDLPLGDTSLVVPAAAMANIIATGPALASLGEVAVPSGTAIHLYGKQPRAGRKVGHVTSVGADPTRLVRIAADTATAIAEPGRGGASDRRRKAVA